VIDFMRAIHDVPIASHSESPRLHNPSSTLQVGPDQQELRPLFLPSKHEEQADRIYIDRPQFQLRIVSLVDSTLGTLLLDQNSARYRSQTIAIGKLCHYARRT
jgi:hypothetical protein